MEKDVGKRYGKKKLRFRWLNKLYADLLGYFWLPCPICRKYFGGHEWSLSVYSSIPTNKKGEAEGVCPECEYKRSQTLTEEDLKKEHDKIFGEYVIINYPFKGITIGRD